VSEEGTVAVSTGLSHVAMSVPVGTLTEAYRTEVREFYGRAFGWREMVALRRPDRLTLATGQASYVNIRERTDPMVCSGYEHVGVVVESPAQVDELWDELDALSDDLALTPLTTGAGGFRSFHFHHLLPLAVEVQFLPSGT
jgi:hypothetical protein